mgnify:CR=1 FL=1
MPKFKLLVDVDSVVDEAEHLEEIFKYTPCLAVPGVPPARQFSLLFLRMHVVSLVLFLQPVLPRRRCVVPTCPVPGSIVLLAPVVW